MKTAHLFPVTLLFLATGVSNCSSQPASTPGLVPASYRATTPCDASVLAMLRIPNAVKCEMMKWELSLNGKAGDRFPSSFALRCTYGVARQGTRGFADGAKTVELKGRCTLRQGIHGNTAAVVYQLVADDPGISLSFFRADQNLLHLLSGDTLMVGNAAWSFTFNRNESKPGSSHRFIAKPVLQNRLTTDDVTTGVFEGRLPCNDRLKELHGITAPGCNLVKTQLTLLRDSLSLAPSRFLLYSIYVGFGDDNKYSCTGTWKVLKGTAADSSAIVYKLEPEQTKSTGPIFIRKADNNNLFLLDYNTNHLVGNDYCSYTLSRDRSK